MTNFTTKMGSLFYSFPLSKEKQKEIDFYLELLDDSDIISLLNKPLSYTGRKPYTACDLFATILYGFAFNAETLRELEERCQYDLRFIYLMDQERPDHSTFGNFINEVILPHKDEIFHKITMTLIRKCELKMKDFYIDGSKFEADANKYKFVWKPTTWHLKLSDKIRLLLNEYHLEKNVPKDGIIPSSQIAEKLVLLGTLITDSKGRKDYKTLYEHLLKALEYEEKERICGDHRNSYYKTDHDATAMCLKEDYYSGLGSNMHAGYNVQIVVSNGIIASYYVSSSRNDVKDLIPSIDRFACYYGFYPENLCADAGYGSLDNWSYLKSHNITNFIKYQNWQNHVSGSRPDLARMNDSDTIYCLNHLEGSKVSIPSRHPKHSGDVFFKIEGCRDCAFKPYCHHRLKDKDELSNERIFEINPDYYLLKQEAETNLLSVKGIEMRVNRSAQVEGAFGVIKQDMHYERLRRIGIERVETEIMLELLGYNIRKYFRYLKKGKDCFEYWKAPEDLKPETVRKPSAKRLSNKVTKKKSVNETAKKSYKYKQ